MKLYIANKNYSSWSMRPWVMLKQAGIEFEEVMVRFDGFDAKSQFKQTLKDINPVGKVPVLVDGELAVWDTLSIAEYAAEKFTDKQLWPSKVSDRARARSICAEMHSGFTGIRSACPMNIDAYLHMISKDPKEISIEIGIDNKQKGAKVYQFLNTLKTIIPITIMGTIGKAKFPKSGTQGANQMKNTLTYLVFFFYLT